MKRFAVLFAICAAATFFTAQDAMAQHGYRGGGGHHHGGGNYYRGNNSSFAISIGGRNGGFSYGQGVYGRPIYGGGFGYGVPVRPVVPVYGGGFYGGYPVYGGGYGYHGGGCRGGGGGSVFIGW
jgi:hypothetical protein